MECKLAAVPPDGYRRNGALIMAIVEAGLLSTMALANAGLAHPDLKTDNVFISGLGTARPKVKIRDLGLGRWHLLPFPALS